jgi:hypothetical protein
MGLARSPAAAIRRARYRERHARFHWDKAAPHGSFMWGPTDRGCLGVSRTTFASLMRPGRHACADIVSLRAGGGLLALKEADPIHQLRPVVLHVADLGADLQCLDRASVGFVTRCLPRQQNASIAGATASTAARQDWTRALSLTGSRTPVGDRHSSRALMRGAAYESEQCAPAVAVRNIRRGHGLRPRGCGLLQMPPLRRDRRYGAGLSRPAYHGHAVPLHHDSAPRRGVRRLAFDLHRQPRPRTPVKE